MKAKSIVLLLVVSCVFGRQLCHSAGMTIDHTCRNIHLIPTNWIVQAKQKLHIVYGHTSHGYQLIYGMTALVEFMNGRGYPSNLYAWNNGGTNDALDLHDQPQGFGRSLGQPDYVGWETATRYYLSTNADCNVVIWSWSGELAVASEANVNTYLQLMSGLENDFTNVTFVYMTGRLDGYGTNWNGAPTYLRNEQIRAFCRANGKVLYDFGDIESYDPDGLVNYMPLRCDDGCNYDGPAMARERNWAIEWQTNHILGVDWFDMDAAHTEPLNGNLKAYAAWWLWARLAGWPGPTAQPPTVTGYNWSGDGFELQFSGVTNVPYKVWATTNQATWQELGTATSTAPGVFRYLDTSATNLPHRFYRAGTSTP